MSETQDSVNFVSFPLPDKGLCHFISERCARATQDCDIFSCFSGLPPIATWRCWSVILLKHVGDHLDKSLQLVVAISLGLNALYLIQRSTGEALIIKWFPSCYFSPQGRPVSVKYNLPQCLQRKKCSYGEDCIRSSASSLERGIFAWLLNFQIDIRLDCQCNMEILSLLDGRLLVDGMFASMQLHIWTCRASKVLPPPFDLWFMSLSRPASPSRLAVPINVAMHFFHCDSIPCHDELPS